MNDKKTNFTAVVLAAGKGKRMRSDCPKALYELAGRPLIYYTLRELISLKRYIKEIVIVVGHKGKEVESAVKECLSSKKNISSNKIAIRFVYQKRLLGTAKAVEITGKKIGYENILVVCADTPLITSNTLSAFISSFLRKKLSCSVISADLNTSNTLGRILRDKSGRIMAISEKIGSVDKTGSSVCRIKEEVNSGIYCFKKKDLFGSLPKIKINKKKGEYFLTDIVELFYRKREKIESYFLSDYREILGINTQSEVYEAEKIMRRRILDRFCLKGVRVIDPDTTFIQEGVVIGKNTIIYPFTFIEKGVIIGHNCFLGPFIRLREGTHIANNTQVGNFVEVNRSRIGNKAKIKHFSYLGDTSVADEVNIGAGVVIANFDGKSKNKTIIKKGAFIGSDSVLVAPVKIGEFAVTGAGSVITKDVKSKDVVVGVPARVLKKKKR